jgi:hypothetical protein
LHAMDGRMVFSGNFELDRAVIDLSQLAIPKGVYFLKVSGQGEISTTKIIYNPTL